LPFALRGMLTLLLEPMLLERARKSGGPALLQPSFKVQRDATHYQKLPVSVAPEFQRPQRPRSSKGPSQQWQLGFG
jgi:hypothetical protein